MAMTRRIIGAALALFLALGAAACDKMQPGLSGASGGDAAPASSEGERPTAGHLTVQGEAGEETTPYANCVSSEENGLFKDSVRLGPEDAAALPELPELVCQSPLYAVPEEGYLCEVSNWALYNEALEEVYARQENFRQPQYPGEYLVSFSARWGDQSRNADCQYFFKLIWTGSGDAPDQDGPQAQEAALAGWLEDYREGRPSRVTLSVMSTIPFTYELACDGSSVYTVTWQGTMKDQVLSEGSYAASEVFERETDYVFGDVLPEGLKSPLIIPRRAADEAPLEEIPAGERKVSPEEGQELALRVRGAMDVYMAETGGMGGSIRVDPDAGERSPMLARTEGYLSLYGHPCYLIRLYESREAMDGGYYNDVMAVNADGGSLIFVQSMVDGSWTPICDREEKIITARG